EDINRFETEFLEHLKHKSSILTTLAQTNVMDDDTAEALKTSIVAFKKGFFGEGDNLLVGAGHEEHEAISDSDVDQEKIVKQKRWYLCSAPPGPKKGPAGQDIGNLGKDKYGSPDPGLPPEDQLDDVDAQDL